MQLEITVVQNSRPGLYRCSHGHFLGEMQGEFPSAKTVMAELECDEIFRAGKNLALLAEPSQAGMKVLGGRTIITGQITGLYEDQTALLRIGDSSLLIEYEDEIDEGQWIALEFESFVIYPFDL